MDRPETNETFETPVLFIIFNRADTAQKVFTAIRAMRPKYLYIAADGPRPTHPDDARKCRITREVVETIDWPCEVKRLYQEENLGCGKGPSTAITWFFENVPEGIIIEDDCLPTPGFFRFCAELLERYRYDTRVMEIGGNNFEPAERRGKEFSYFFSARTYIWGWATWRRAWNLYSFEMKHYPEIKRKGYLNDYFYHKYEQEHYDYIHEKMFVGDNITSRKTVWDYQWQFTIMINSGVVIVPEANLVTNLGFGDAASNTSDPQGAGHNLKAEKLDFPLRHPDVMMIDHKRDDWYFNFICTSRAFRFRSRIKNLIPRPLFRMALPFYQSLRGMLSKKYARRLVKPGLPEAAPQP